MIGHPANHLMNHENGIQPSKQHSLLCTTNENTYAITNSKHPPNNNNTHPLVVGGHRSFGRVISHNTCAAHQPRGISDAPFSNLLPKKPYQQDTKNVNPSQKENIHDACISQPVLERTAQESTPQSQTCTNTLDDSFSSNPRYVSAIAKDIFNDLFETFICRDYKDLHEIHSELNESMRCLLIDWLLEVCYRYSLKPETFFSAVQLLDIYCRISHQSNRTIPRDSFQKIGITCLLITAKIEEIYPPEIREFVNLCDGAYSLKSVAKQEIDICFSINFNLSFATPYTFLIRYSTVLSFTSQQLNNALFILHVWTMPYNLSPIYYKPSLLASASAFIASQISEQAWNQQIKQHSEMVQFHESTEFLPFIGQLIQVVKILQIPECPFKAIRKKYPELNSISLL